MALRLDDARRAELLSALLGAFPEAADLAGAVWVSTGLQLRDEIALIGGKKTVFTAALQLAEGQGWLEALIRAGLKAAPMAAPLARVAVALDLAPLLPPQTVPHGVASGQGGLEEIIRKRRPPVLMSLFTERLTLLSRAVCWIGLPELGREDAQFGSGFLVGPDLVLTNHHVIGRVLRGEVAEGDVRCRFDHLDAEAGGVALGLAAGWHLDSALPAPGDGVAGGRAPEPDELDYALIRLERPVGTEEAGGGPRGWLRLSAEPPPLVTEDLIFVVQQPAKVMDLQDGAQRIALGLVLGFSPDGLRVRHDAGTTAGSSGAPALTADLQPAALHHASQPLRDASGVRVAPRPAYNQAVPLRPILRRMRERNVAPFWEA
jgi:hypothetical protein